MTSTSDFFNEDRCQSLRPQLFVYAEKIDFRGFEDILSDSKIDRDSRDKGYELS
jgi:hypothetical protein